MTTTTTVRTTTRPAKATRRRCFNCKGKVSRECREGRRVVAWACGWCAPKWERGEL